MAGQGQAEVSNLRQSQSETERQAGSGQAEWSEPGRLENKTRETGKTGNTLELLDSTRLTGTDKQKTQV